MKKFLIIILSTLFLFSHVYAETFTNEGFDSIKAITMIEKDDLKDMGVKKGHMKLILGGIEMLNKEEDNNDNGNEDDD